jgi:hypothetical protein
MKFWIDDVRHWWRLWCVRVQIVAMFVQGAMIIDPISLLQGMNMMPPHVRNMLPEAAVRWVMGALFVLSLVTILARNVKQPKLQEKRDGAA